MAYIDKQTVTEAKVKAAAIATFVVTTVLAGVLGTTVTDFVPALPDALEVPALGVIQAGIVWLISYRTRSAAGKLSPSTIAAVQNYLAERGNKRV